MKINYFNLDNLVEKEKRENQPAKRKTKRHFQKSKKEEIWILICS
jgi:hypothetical protein